MLYLLYGFDGKSMVLYLWSNDAFGGGMEWCLFSTKRDACGDIYGLPFSLYGICIASYSLHWHMELCYESMVLIVSVQHRLLGITMQLHTLLGMKAWHSIAFALWFWGCEVYVLEYWWLISSFTRLYYLIRYILLFPFGLLVMDILNRCLMNL